MLIDHHHCFHLSFPASMLKVLIIHQRQKIYDMKTLHVVPQRYQHFFCPSVVAFWWFNGVRAPSEILAEEEEVEVVMVVAVEVGG